MNQKDLLIIDYGMGNVTSVVMALDFLGAEYRISGESEDIRNAQSYILPGVGAFHAAMDNLQERNLIEVLTEEVVKAKKPFLGICLGLQLLAENSTEKGFTKGLGWIKGQVELMDAADDCRIPHVGWNNISVVGESQLFDRITGEMNYYFDHSYHLKCPNEIKTAVCDYGMEVVAAVQQDNIMATQFHPEKSQRNGLKLLRNFLNLIENYQDK